MNGVVKKLIGEITELAYEITNKTKHDVLVRYSGHVNKIEVDIYMDGYSNEKFSIGLLNLYINSEGRPISKLKQTKRKLKKLLEEE
jgi:hypothetical protein